MSVIIHSKAFWTAVIDVLAVIVLNVIGLEPDLWAPIAVLLGVIAGLFCIDDIQQAANLRAERSSQVMRDTLLSIEKLRKGK